MQRRQREDLGNIDAGADPLGGAGTPPLSSNIPTGGEARGGQTPLERQPELPPMVGRAPLFNDKQGFAPPMPKAPMPIAGGVNRVGYPEQGQPGMRVSMPGMSEHTGGLLGGGLGVGGLEGGGSTDVLQTLLQLLTKMPGR